MCGRRRSKLLGCKLETLEQEEGSGLSSHRLALTMLIKIVKSLGCAYGCGEGHRGLSGDRLRMQVRLLSLPHVRACVSFTSVHRLFTAIQVS